MHGSSPQQLLLPSARPRFHTFLHPPGPSRMPSPSSNTRLSLPPAFFALPACWTPLCYVLCPHVPSPLMQCLPTTLVQLTQGIHTSCIGTPLGLPTNTREVLGLDEIQHTGPQGTAVPQAHVNKNMALTEQRQKRWH